MKKIAFLIAMSMTAMTSVAHAGNPKDAFVVLRAMELLCGNYAKDIGMEINHGRIAMVRANFRVTAKEIDIIDKTVKEQSKSMSNKDIQKFCGNVVFMPYYTVNGIPLNEAMKRMR